MKQYIAEFLLQSMTLLRHHLQDGLIRPSKKHVEIFLKITKQTTKQGVRALLGLLGYRTLLTMFS